MERKEEVKPNGPLTEAASKARELRDDLGEVAGTLYDRAESALGEIRKSGERNLEKWYDEGRRQVRNLRHHIQDDPIKSMLLAAGAGVFAGLLMQRWGGRRSGKNE